MSPVRQTRLFASLLYSLVVLGKENLKPRGNPSPDKQFIVFCSKKQRANSYSYGVRALRNVVQRSIAGV